MRTFAGAGINRPEAPDAGGGIISDVRYLA